MSAPAIIILEDFASAWAHRDRGFGLGLHLLHLLVPDFQSGSVRLRAHRLQELENVLLLGAAPEGDRGAIVVAIRNVVKLGRRLEEDANAIVAHRLTRAAADVVGVD